MCFEFASSDGSCRLPRRLLCRFQSCAREAYEAEIGGRLIFPCPARLFHGTEGDVATIGLKFSQAKICRNMAHRVAGLIGYEGPPCSRVGNAEPFRHLLIQKSPSRAIGLNPIPIDHKLWDGAFASVFHHLFSGTRRGLDVNFFKGDIMLGQKALGLAAVRAPEG